jgi:hypothetical protein
MLQRFPATGIVWDELKSLQGEDFSQAAIDRLGHPAAEKEMVEGTVTCFASVNRRLKAAFDRLRIACFLYADSEQSHIERCAEMKLLDEFGCDGKCFRPGESTAGEGGGNKVLLGGNDARFAAAAMKNGCVPFSLLETQLLDTAAMELSLSRLPEFLTTKTGHLVYYYYPYGLSNPERFMPLLGAAMAAWRTNPVAMQSCDE